MKNKKLMFIIMSLIVIITYNDISTRNHTSSYLSKNGEVYNKQLEHAWSSILECYITKNYCHENTFRYFIPIKEYQYDDD